MRSIKRGESPTWVPSDALKEYFATHGDSPQARLEERQKKDNTPPLLPAAELRTSPRRSPNRETSDKRPHSPAVEVQRPRSALHSGDFREGSPEELDEQRLPFEEQHDGGTFSAFPHTPWYTGPAQPPCNPIQKPAGLVSSSSSPSQLASLLSRTRAPSFGSPSTNYVLKAPTSPLVHQANNPDLDFSLKTGTSEKVNRRRTFSPGLFQSLHSSPPGTPFCTSPSTSPGPYRRHDRFHFQTHRPRRSLTSTLTLQPTSLPHTAGTTRLRRQSRASEAPPLHHASMVGSYEESILRGRMSTSPSKPLNFTAKIGVFCRGTDSSSVKCPPHVTVPFPAVFYSYPTSGSGRTISDDSPSPYVGYIDIENSLSPETKRPRRRHRPQLSLPPKCPCVDHGQDERVPNQLRSLSQERRAREKRSRRSQSPKSPPGGSYRIPQQGQLQIVIKNPNKTAVKLFLVPYDLEGMEAGMKTFIRQRSYSIGPAVEVPISRKASEGTDGPEIPLDPNEDKPVLRYLIHLNICCPSKGRFYLHSGIRVVFANRVPDDKERLRNEVQFPEPRYSSYKPSKEASSGLPPTSDKIIQRASSDFRGDIGTGPMDLDALGAGAGTHFQFPAPSPLLFPSQHSSAPSEYPAATNSNSGRSPEMTLSSDFLPSDGYSTTSGLLNGDDAPFSPPTSLAPIPRPDTTTTKQQAQEQFYQKLSKGDVGYGGHLYGLSEDQVRRRSLLARRLRSLDMMNR